VWLSNKSAKLFTLGSTKWYATAFALRQRMLNFVQNFQYYMMFEVIEPNWQQFESNMHNVCSHLYQFFIQMFFCFFFTRVVFFEFLILSFVRCLLTSLITCYLDG